MEWLCDINNYALYYYFFINILFFYFFIVSQHLVLSTASGSQEEWNRTGVSSSN